MPENFMTIVAFATTIIWFGALLVWFFKRKFSKPQTAKAKVIHKQINEYYSKTSGTGKVYHYYVTFQIGDKRKTFSVSELSYNGYRKGEKGTIQYAGDRLIDFH